MSGTPKVVEGRSCNACTLCCKLMGIRELDKPRGTWCSKCAVAKGCTIHGTHPAECRDFFCGYLLNPDLDERWKPAKSKLVLLYSEVGAPRIAVHVDPARPDAWREEPFYSQIKQWAKAAVRVQGQVIVWVGKKTIFVLPDSDKDLGEVRSDQVIVTWEKKGPLGVTLDVSVVQHDDPILNSAEQGKVRPNMQSRVDRGFTA